jgi:uncharacterized protein involved in outer membrane biogenesis
VRIRRVAAVLAVLVVVAAAAVAAVRHLLHPAQLTAALAERVKDSTGRELLISGPVELRFFPRPAIVVEDLRFGNAPWGSHPWMAKIGRAEAEFPWRALLGHAIDITRIDIFDVHLLLETDRSGNGNWVMRPRDAGPADLGWLTAFDADELTLRRVMLDYRDGASGNTTRVNLDQAGVQVPAARRPITFRIRGAYSGNGFEAGGSAGAIATLLAGTSYPISLSATTGGSKLEVSGELGQPLQVAGVSVNVRAEGSNLADLGRLLPHFGPLLTAHAREGYPLAEAPYRVNAHVTGSWGDLSVSGLDVALGRAPAMEFRATGRMEMRWSASRPVEIPALDLQLQARGAELKEFLALAGKPVPAVGPYALSGRLSGAWDAPRLSGLSIEIGSRDRVHLTASGEIARPRELAGLDLRVEARAEQDWRTGEQSGAPRLPPLRLKTRLRDRPGGYALDELELEVAGARVDAALVARRSDDRLSIAGKAASPLIDLARLSAATDAAAPAPGRHGRDEPRGALPALLQFADLDLELQIGRLVLRDRRALTGISGRVALNREGLAVSAGRLSAGGARWRVQGRMSNPAQGSGIDAALEVQGGELADQFAFWGGSITSLGPFQGSARAQGSLEVLRLTGIEAQAGRPGQARVAARGEIADVSRGDGFDLALSGEIPDPGFLSRLAGQDLPRLPPAKFTARFSKPGGKYAFDDLKLALGRTALQGRLEYLPAPRRQVRVVVTGTTLDLSEIRMPRGGARAAPGKKDDPFKALAVDADFRLERLVLPDKRVLGPVSGRTELAGGVAELHQVTLAIEGANAVLDGTVAEPLEAKGLDLALKANVKNSAALAGLTGVAIPRLPPFSLSGRLNDVENGYALKGLQLDFPATRIRGDLTATRSASRLAVQAALVSPRLDVSEFLEAKPEQPAPAAGERLFSDALLPFGVLRSADAALDLKIEELRVPNFAPLGPVVARLALAGGRLKADPVRIGTPAGEELQISGTVRALSGDRGSFDLRIDGKSIDLGAALGQARPDIRMSGGATDFRLQLASSGASVRALMDALDGSARISVGPARIHHEIIDLSKGPIERVLDLVNPFRKTDPDTDLKCLAIRVSIADGVITSDRGIAFETTKFNVVASGTINLGTEALALGVTPTVNQGIALGTDQIARDVRIGGTLANPDIGMGMAGTARSAVSLYADVATAGGWLLVDALWRKSRADPNPCATALREPR